MSDSAREIEDRDTEDSENSDNEQENNTPPKGVDPDFCRRIQTMKWKLYQIIVLGPEIDTPESQNNELIRTYMITLEQLYQFLEGAQKGGVTERSLIQFPLALRSENLSLAEWVRNYFKQNGPADTIPYRDYLNTSLRIYPFVHHKRMMGGGEDDVEWM